MEIKLHFNSSRVSASCLTLLIHIPIHTTHTPMSRSTNSFRNWLPFCVCYVNNLQQDCNAYVSKLTYIYNSHVHRSLNTLSFDLVLYWRMLDFASKSTLSAWKLITASEKWAGFLATPQHSMNIACPFPQCTQGRYKRYFDRHLHPRSRKDWDSRLRVYRCIGRY